MDFQITLYADDVLEVNSKEFVDACKAAVAEGCFCPDTELVILFKDSEGEIAPFEQVRETLDTYGYFMEMKFFAPVVAAAFAPYLGEIVKRVFAWIKRGDYEKESFSV